MSSTKTEEQSQAASEFKREGAKTAGPAVLDGTRKRITAAVSIRKKDRLELMTKRRMEMDSDEDVSSGAKNSNGEPSGRGSHRYHEQPLEPAELHSRFAEFIDMIRTDPSAAASQAGNASEADRGGASPEAAAKAAEANAVQRVKDGLKYTRQLFRLEDRDPFASYREAGGVAALLTLVECPDYDIAYNAVWCLTTIGTGSASDVECCISLGLVPKMINCLVHPVERIRHQAAWCLGNICGDGAAHRDLVLRSGGLHAVTACVRGRKTPDGPDGEFENAKVTTLRNCVWLIAQLCRFKPCPALSDIGPAIPVLKQLLCNHPDEEIQDDCIWAISFITDGQVERLSAVMDAGGIMERVVQIFQQAHPNAKAAAGGGGNNADQNEQGDGNLLYQLSHRPVSILPCLRVFGNFTAREETTDLVFRWGVIAHLAPFLDPGMHRTIRKEACWLLSNCLAGTEDQARQILDAQLVPLLVKNIEAPEFEVKKEAIWAIANLAQYCPADVIRYMVEACNVLEPLVRSLGIPEERSNQLAQEALEPILRAGMGFAQNNNGRNPYADRVEQLGGLGYLQDLCNHTSNVLSMNAVEILQRYYSRDDGEPDPSEGHWDLGPPANDNHQGGGGGNANQENDGYGDGRAAGWGSNGN